MTLRIDAGKLCAVEEEEARKVDPGEKPQKASDGAIRRIAPEMTEVPGEQPLARSEENRGQQGTPEHVAPLDSGLWDESEHGRDHQRQDTRRANCLQHEPESGVGQSPGLSAVEGLAHIGEDGAG